MENVDKDVSMIDPAYPYTAMIRPPTDPSMEISEKGTKNALAKNIRGIISYVGMMSYGDTRASNVVSSNGTFLPLGGKNFMKTLLKCKDVETGDTVNRYVYMNNVPTGRIPFMDGTETNFRGLVPGMVGNLERMSPLNTISRMFEASVPPCKKVKLQVINDNRLNRTMERHVALSDLKTLLNRNEHINSFNNRPSFTQRDLENWENLNPKEGFNIREKRYEMDIYHVSLLLLFIYICYCLIRNRL